MCTDRNLQRMCGQYGEVISTKTMRVHSFVSMKGWDQQRSGICIAALQRKIP